MSNDIVTRLRCWEVEPYPIPIGACIRNGAVMEEAAGEIERLQVMLHEIAEHLGNALYSDEWRTREYAIVAFSRYETAHPHHERDLEKMVNQ